MSALTLTIVEESLTLTLGESLGLPADQQAALANATSPSALNPYITRTDISGFFPLRFTSSGDFNNPAVVAPQLQTALGFPIAHGFSGTTLIFLKTTFDTGSSQYATFRVIKTFEGVTYDYREGWSSEVMAGSTVYILGVVGLDLAVTGDLATHVAASDPHGDRAYSAGQLNAHLDSSTAHAASDLSYTPNQTILAETVQGAIDAVLQRELNHESSAVAHPEIRSGIAVPLNHTLFSSLTWNNQGSSVRHDFADHLTLIPQITGGGSVSAMRVLEMPLASGAGDFTVVGAVRQTATQSTVMSTGLCIRKPGVVYCVTQIGSASFKADTRSAYDYAGLPSSVQGPFSPSAIIQPIWFKIERVNSNLAFYLSLDGQVWMSLNVTGVPIVDSDVYTHAGFYAEDKTVLGWSVAELHSFSIT